MRDTYYPVKREIVVEGIHSFYYRENDRDFYFKDARRNNWRIIYVDSGVLSISADNKSYLLRQGDIIFHEPLEVHALASNGREINRILVCDFKASGSGMDRLRNKVFALNPYQQDLIKSIASEAKNTFKTKNSMLVLKENAEFFGAFQLTAAYLERLFVDIIRWGKPRSAGRRSSGAKNNIEIVLAQSVKEYMKAHITDNLSLQDICHHFHVGKSYLSEVFKMQTGCSIMEYYIRFKIELAKELLEDGRQSVTEISAAAGFSSVHHFVRSFKSHTGTTPGEYGKRYN